MKQWNCSRTQAPGILDLRGSPLPLLSLPGKLGHLSVRVPHSKFKKKKDNKWQTSFCVVFFEDRTHYNHLQLYDPAFNSFLSFPTHDVSATVCAPGPLFSSLSQALKSPRVPGNEQALPPPMPCPWGKAPRTRVRDESQEISWSLPKVSDGNEGTLQTIAGNGYHYLCKFLTTTTVTWGTPDILLHVAANYQRPAVQILTAAVACARISPGLCSFHPLSLPDLVCNSGYITSKNLTFLCHPAATHQSKGNGFTLKWKKNQFRDLNAQRK